MDSLPRILPRLITPLGATLLACLPISPVAPLVRNPAQLSFTPGALAGHEVGIIVAASRALL
jgi:hypothetical protein